MNETDGAGEKSNQDRADLLKPLGVRKVRLKAKKFLGAAADGGPVAEHFFSKKQVEFLQAYSETLDFPTALEKSGLKPHHVRRSAYLMKEVEYINSAAQYKHRNKAALGSFYKFMDAVQDKFEDSLSSTEIRKASMTTLARLHETALKVSGEFSEQVENTGIVGVRVSINIGPPPEPPAPEKSGNVIDV